MAKFYSFIRGSLEWPFSELYFFDALLWNQHKFIAFNIFPCKILITSCKILIITVIYNKTPNELTPYTILCRKVTILYRQGLASLFQVWEKLNSKKSFSSSCFIAGDIRVKVTCSHKIVFNGHAIPYFLREVYTVKFFFQSISWNTNITLISQCIFTLNSN